MTRLLATAVAISSKHREWQAAEAKKIENVSASRGDEGRSESVPARAIHAQNRRAKGGSEEKRRQVTAGTVLSRDRK